MDTSADGSINYQNIKVIGPVSVKRIGENTIDWDAVNVFTILGPTGAGKSTFVEALSSKGSLNISSNQLEGCTQSISTYQVLNVICGNEPVYLIDVPGFSDTKISELSIVMMMREWIAQNEADDFGRILYLTPVNNVRLAGSQREVLKTFQAITGVSAAENITIVSTMWDAVWGESATKRSEQNFHQFRDNIWKDYIAKGSDIVKFLNTRDSALSILDNACGRFTRAQYQLENVISNSRPFQQAPFAVSLYQTLQTRIQNLQIEQSNIILELEAAAGHKANRQLTATLWPRLEEVEETLVKFSQELHDFGPSPSSVSTPPSEKPGIAFETGTMPLSIHGEETLLPPATLQQTQPLVTHEPEGATPPSTLIVSHLDYATTPRSIEDNGHAVTVPNVPQPSSHLGSQRRRPLAQAMHSMKCWGKTIGDRHLD